jgi:hypothetical protein
VVLTTRLSLSEVKDNRTMYVSPLVLHGVFQGNLYLLYFLLLLLLTAIGLSPGGSSPTLVQTKIKIHKTITK